MFKGFFTAGHGDGNGRQGGGADGDGVDVILTADDLDTNRPNWVDPIGIDVLGATAWTMPPNSQGYATLAATWLVSLRTRPPDGAEEMMREMAGRGPVSPAGR